MAKILIVFFLLLISLSGYTADIHQCVKSSYSPFFQHMKKIEQGPMDRIEALDKTCEELHIEGNYRKQSLFESAALGFSGFVGGLIWGQAWSSFSTLSGDINEQRYNSQLQAIKKIRDPYRRIQLVYELAASHSGQYDYKMFYEPTYMRMIPGSMTPGNFLKKFREEGSVGICREFASLFQWSLHQVARHFESRTHALSETDFSAAVINATIPAGQHAWIRVSVPKIIDSKLIGFDTFDLDTTMYQDQFTFVFPRLSGLSERTLIRLQTQCQAIQECLMN